MRSDPVQEVPVIDDPHENPEGVYASKAVSPALRLTDCPAHIESPYEISHCTAISLKFSNYVACARSLYSVPHISMMIYFDVPVGAVVVVNQVSSFIALRHVQPVDKYIGIQVPVVEVSYFVPYAVVLALYRFISCPMCACAEVHASNLESIDDHDCVFDSVILKSQFVDELTFAFPSINIALQSTQI